ncbi:Asp-tRNA(Asn)/Glu-tRNA(Gln) amidotransferase subunit GatB [Acidobacteria bacterium AH-259-D05]|nr:Asp-tRNA(Asn)/Glu-tRNA(Gln) amidotransferase subunit GatB [Acidobacteria bacterium AH-259-D05]
MEFEPVIGLEVHAQLLTRSKIFCSCSTEFGAPPNSNTCPVCLGLPGALPVLNRQAVAMAIKAGLALSCRINRESIFARKNYFYPDLPKGYQISQYDLPLAEDGKIEIFTGERRETGKIVDYRKKAFGITRVHLEEDAGKSIHVSGGDTHVDLNRTGVPLIEIVSEPDFRSSQEAYDYLNYLRRALSYLEICDGNMEEGSLRCDANVSVRPAGSSALGTKTEIKNLNSFRFLQKALDYEIERQVQLIRGHGEVQQETRMWDEERQKTIVMRSKEEAHDYRYFAEPDLLPVVISQKWLEELKAEIPELPEQRRERFIQQYVLTQEEALLLTQTRQLADYFEMAVKSYQQPKAIFNWILGDLTHHLKQDNRSIAECPVRPEQLADLVRLIDQGEISGKMAKQVFEKLYKTGEDPQTIISQEGLQQISDQDQLQSIVEHVLESNPKQVEAYRAGKTGLLGFFMGQVMKETGGQANPQMVTQMLQVKLQSHQ